MVSSNPPDRPGVRFSCSPRILDRFEVRSSASDTALASLLVTVNDTSPEVTEAGLGWQPCGVSETLTVVAFPVSDVVLSLLELPLEQPATMRTAPVTSAARPVMREVLPRMVLRRPSEFTGGYSFCFHGKVLSGCGDVGRLRRSRRYVGRLRPDRFA